MKIIATGSSVPQLELTNDMLSQMMDTSDEWIRTRTGIQSRRILSTESLTDLAIAAAKKCLDQSSLQGSDIDYILCHNIVSDIVTPSMASIINKEIGSCCPTVDLNSACTGFIYALDIADSLLKTGKARRILIVCAEEMSHFIDWDKRETCVLFGDAAGAVIVEDGGDETYFHLSTKYTDALNCNSKYASSPFRKREMPYHFLEMRGRDVFKLAILNSSNDIKKVLEKANIKPNDVDYYLLHQANIRILEAIRKELDLPEKSVPHNIEKRGNTSSASIPVLLDELNRSHTFKKGDLLAFSAFGAGFTSGACLIRWQLD